MKHFSPRNDISKYCNLDNAVALSYYVYVVLSGVKEMRDTGRFPSPPSFSKEYDEGKEEADKWQRM